MSVEKRKILDLLAGKKGPGLELSNDDRQEAVNWLHKMGQTAHRLEDSAASGSLDRWADAGEVDDDLFDRPKAQGELAAVLRGGSETEPGSVMSRYELPTVGNEVGRSIAREIYGDEDQPFQMILHCQSIAPLHSQVELEMEVMPPPLIRAIAITIQFGQGQELTLTIEVPVSERPSTRSAPSPPMDRKSLQFQSGSWAEGEWPPRFQFV